MQTFLSNKPFVRAYSYHLRMIVFVQEQHISPELEFDELDTDHRYYLITINEGKPVGTARYQFKEQGVLQPDRLCVHPDYRGQGIGRNLLNELEKQALKDGCHHSLLSAEVTAIPFYVKSGYHQVSDTYLEDGLPCVQMKKKLRA
ncbi:GNAT family N-acetyltransferase [Vagococcus intermedius]|uniref:GNAT family N-acetyltransferase n=1 Tax=Vagococcus intermedius TaxID=2991418 RepID=A0AAF0CTI1_9ENTE|nr:GNAT family N-acetyltransferase [Vagococcus intermedius]WEG72714.1 GNAT family N-acetyltransferase [Vagococcus intermedius]WEG74799.1 GNAT family N-acetyltransferase [Vagococcus intermedius]